MSAAIRTVTAGTVLPRPWSYRGASLGLGAARRTSRGQAMFWPNGSSGTRTPLSSRGGTIVLSGISGQFRLETPDRSECRADLPQFCRVASSEYSGRRAPTSAGFAPFMTLRANRLIPVPDGVDAEQAALIEPASVALHAIRLSRMAVGDVACVVGCGPIGLMAIPCARLAGAGTVIAVEPDAGRRALALDLGANTATAPGADLREAVNDATGGLRSDGSAPAS
ncbi:MAG: zinc-binding dehydrogenase [Actinomycetia bacterium]|nr:zinc-binding dehydrogenase [Actinomycetes bacterium]